MYTSTNKENQMADLIFPRGAEWRQWDLHVHTPASYEWSDGKHFNQMTDKEKDAAIDKLIRSLNKADPAVFVLMDYWTFDGWLFLKKRLADKNAPKLVKKVFPGIELRLVSPTQYRLNAHVVFSDDITEQDLQNFKAKLSVALIDQPLSDECLVRLVREKVGSDKLEKIGHNKDKVNKDDMDALLAGSKVAEITCSSYQDAIKNVPCDKAIGFMPWTTNDGLAKADWETHYAYVIGLMNSSPIFETRCQDLWAAFSGIETEKNKSWIVDFQSALSNKPRLAVSGSDAHSFSDYGNFPSGKKTWIKADPTFLGLQQAIKEPAKRSYIGERPQKLVEVDENKTYFIDSIAVHKVLGSSIKEDWLSNCNLPLNSDLVAIIGNKGSGKSALADIIALLGNSRQVSHFSFLSSKRFRQKPKELAKNFTGTIKWCDSTATNYLLSENPPAEAVEMVRYIPQAHFEKLCNDHISGQSDVFEKELRAVIFSHTSTSIRQKALDFEQLIDQQESRYRDQLGEYRKELKRLNNEIETIEAQLQPEIKKGLQELSILKEKQIEEHKKIEPVKEKKPAEKPTVEQQKVFDELEKITKALLGLDKNLKASVVAEELIVAKDNAIHILKDRLGILQRQYNQFGNETAEYATILGLNISDVASFTVNEKKIDALSSSIPNEHESIMKARGKHEAEKIKLLSEQSTFNAKLGEPQKRYDISLKNHQAWEKKLTELIGTLELPDTFEGIKARINQLDQLPDMLENQNLKRIELTGNIYDTLNSQREAREQLFQPVQNLIQNNSLIRDEYKLQFQAALSGSVDSLSSSLFDLIKQNSGEFRGEDDSYAAVRKIAEKYNFSKRQDILDFVSDLHNKVTLAAKGSNKEAVGIASLLRVNKEASEVYDLMFGLSFLEPRYSLLFQDTHIEQLSPGQRGALLLIFYLLVDKGKNPIILDQPEENLDNETVVSLLVPVLREAKKKRQIIMVTHNPNLAVVCDAEQIIYSSFDRKSGSRIKYVSGSIENPDINQHVVVVLEGTMPAFDNRRIKYH